MRLLVAYFIGKISSAVAVLCADIFQKKKESSDPKGWSDEVSTFVGGLAGGSTLTGKSPLYEYYSGFKAQISFYSSSGLVLIASALIPGDGRFRFAEAVAGVVFIAMAVRSTREEDKLIYGMLGVALGNALSGVPIEKLVSGGTTILKLWPVVSAVSAALKNKETAPVKTTPDSSNSSSPSVPTEPVRGDSKARQAS